MAYTALSSGTLTGNGDHLICSLIFLYPSLCALREIGLQNMESQLHFAQTHQHLIPDQFHWEVSTSTVGVGALYHGGVPVIQRTRGLPYQQTEQHCVAIGWGWGWWVGGVCVCVGGDFGKIFWPAECLRAPLNQRMRKPRWEIPPLPWWGKRTLTGTYVLTKEEFPTYEG